MPAVVVARSAGNPTEFEYKTTIYVWICGIIAAFGGLMFGYDIGISGGVTAMDDFLEKFFHPIYVRKHRAKENNYCKYDDQRLQLFTSSLYLAALVTCFVASRVCDKMGRRPAIQAASLFFLVGVSFNAAAQNILMLIIGRILLGIGVGFANQAVPLFLSEIAPVKIRGALNILFQFNITLGILAANIVNYYTSNIHPWGWRLSLGLAGIPALLLCLGSLAIAETPTSLIERGKIDQGKETLRRIRGIENVDPEFNEILAACNVASTVQSPFRELRKRRSRPQLIIGILMQVFQQLTGINAIMFYAPVLFQTMGFKNDASLLSAVVTGSVNAVSTVVSIIAVDKLGRRFLLLQAAVQMFICQSIIGILLGKYLKATDSLEHSLAIVVVVLVCFYVSSFAWSWGPLGWLIPSETFPLETRAAGFSFAVSSNMIFTFIIAQAFLSMMCHLRAGIFGFFAAWILVMGTFVWFFLPETKGVPIDEMADKVWRQHWYWKRYMDQDGCSKVENLEGGSSE